jgi:hypothetical protein
MDHGHGGEAGVLEQLAKGEFKVVHNRGSPIASEKTHDYFKLRSIFWEFKLLGSSSGAFE